MNNVFQTRQRRINIILLHILLALLAMNFKIVGYIWLISIILYGIYKIIRTRNITGIAHCMAAYMVGAEVLFRILRVSLLWETGKYAVILFLSIGLIVQKRDKFSFLPVLYLLLLIPSIFLLDFSNINITRQFISFNLSGPLCLMIATVYFYKRNFKKHDLEKLFAYFLYPVMAMFVVIVVTAPNISEMEFALQSNISASGGYSGTNQVSTIYGAGACIICLTLILNMGITTRKSFDFIIASLFFLSALFTLSRGGVLGCLLAVIFMMLTYIFYFRKHRKILNQLLQFAIYFVIFILIFDYINSLTGNSLLHRFETKVYIEEVEFGRESEGLYDKYTTGRIALISADLKLFFNNILLGVGPGNAKVQRNIVLGTQLKAAHTEQSRMLAEHGLFGLLALLILIFLPIRCFYLFSGKSSKVIMITLIIYSFFTMGHAATRLALTGFLYGLAFVQLIPDNPLIRIKQNSNPK